MGDNIVVSEKSAPTYWFGGPVLEINTRTYYARCEYEGEIYDIHDFVLLNCNSRPFFVAQIMEMWEQGKKKWLRVLWFWRPCDIEKELEADTTISKEKRSQVEATLQSVHPQELFQSSRMDYNYPSTLVSKCKVKFYKDDNLDRFLKKDTQKHFFYKRHWNPESKTITEATPYVPPSYPECIDYLPRQKRPLANHLQKPKKKKKKKTC